MPNYKNRYARTSNKKRQQVYDVALQILEEAGESVAQQTIVDALREQFPKNNWSCKTLGGFLKPLVSRGTIIRERKRVLGILATYYTLALFKYEETPLETHDMDD